MRLCFMALASAVIAFAACSRSERAGSGNSGDDVLQLDTVFCSDSIEAVGGTADCRFKVVYPVAGSKVLVDSVNSWILSQLDHAGFSFGNDSIAYPEPGGVRDMVRMCCDSMLAKAMSELSDSTFVSIGYPTGYVYEAEIVPVYVSPKAVTYSSSAYVYLGGAHGGVVSDQLTFSTADGRGYGWNMFREGTGAVLSDMIRKGLAEQYFETDADMSEWSYLSGDTLPLPVRPPYFMADGVHFEYQQYEIAPYAAGMPWCVFEYSQIDSLLAPAAALLVP